MFNPACGTANDPKAKNQDLKEISGKPAYFTILGLVCLFNLPHRAGRPIVIFYYTCIDVI